jgi:hypothetical protein
MGSSECELCKENEYLKEYILEDERYPMSYSLMVCRNCVEEGLKLRIKQMRGLLND